VDEFIRGLKDAFSSQFDGLEYVEQLGNENLL